MELIIVGIFKITGVLGHNLLVTVLVIKKNLLFNTKLVEISNYGKYPQNHEYSAILSNDNSTLYFLLLKNCFKGYESNE